MRKVLKRVNEWVNGETVGYWLIALAFFSAVVIAALKVDDARTAETRLAVAEGQLAAARDSIEWLSRRPAVVHRTNTAVQTVTETDTVFVAIPVPVPPPPQCEERRSKFWGSRPRHQARVNVWWVCR